MSSATDWCPENDGAHRAELACWERMQVDGMTRTITSLCRERALLREVLAQVLEIGLADEEGVECLSERIHDVLETTSV